MSNVAGYVTPEEAAAILGVSHAQACRYARENQIPSIRLGQAYLMKEEDVRAFQRRPRGNPNLLKSRRQNHQSA